MNCSWTMPAPPSDGTAFKRVDNRWGDGGCIDHPCQTLHQPRGRPPLHPPPPPPSPPPSPPPPPPTAAQGRRDEGSAPKRTWKRKDGIDCGGSSELRRQQHLQRNRVAASKYRRKHKTWMDRLAERCREETEKRDQLHDLARALREEVLSLKEQAVHQSGCDCRIMKLYLERQNIQLLAPPLSGNPVSQSPSSASSLQDSISPTSLSVTSSLDDRFFSDFNFD